MRVYVDHTHLWRRVTGIERVTIQLFSQEALAPLDVVPVKAGGMGGMIAGQTLGLPARLAGMPTSLLLCPGFPPTPLLHAFGSRVIPYIHDLFLLSRRGDLNWRAKLYSALPFGLAVRRLPRFMVNSADTGAKLAAYCREDADIIVYRPPAQNVFELSSEARSERATPPAALRLVALGTVEPRKNLLAAARIVAFLRQQGYPRATLEIIGRRGWGDDWAALSTIRGVTLHGFQTDACVGQILDGADALICTSHEEGLGLPLLEAQFAGLPVVAPDQPVFREVLGASGLFIDPSNPGAPAALIVRHLTAHGWRRRFVQLAAANLRRWNATATADRDRVVELLGRLVREGENARRQFGVAS
ncbi:MAG TPA: glycosyltransferase [Pseudolabrys sp.]|jgi:glycosyltransferase involved in cell wall biosynthesis